MDCIVSPWGHKELDTTEQLPLITLEAKYTVPEDHGIETEKGLGVWEPCLLSNPLRVIAFLLQQVPFS